MTIATGGTATLVTASHPLDPLTEGEIQRTTALLKASGRLTPRMRIMAYSLHEPQKSDVLAWRPGQSLPRAVDVVIRDHERRLTIEALVELSDGTVAAWRERGDVQPALTYPEVFAAQEAALADPAFQQALARRGLTESDAIVLFPWTAGNWGPGDAPEKGRLIRLQATVSRGPEDNYYARPLEGLIVTVELDGMAVRVDDFGAVPVPQHPGNYTPAGITEPGNVPHFPQGTRIDLKTISITQPEGASYQVDGQQVSWQKWRFRVGFTPREGLVLHLVEYLDRGRYRPILYRASLSEMFVPYGDPTPSHNFKNVFDTGEVGIGVLANSLELGCDCLGEIFYFDAFVNDPEGQPVPIKNCMCMHEEDFSLLWKHLEYNADGSTRAEVRRSRRLVISMIATVGNYEYGYYWYLYQDGSLQFEVKLTGIIAPAAIAPGEQPVSGTLGAPVAYKLVPGSNTFPFFHESSPQWERGGFVRNHLWVTAYDERERYAAGDYPNQQRGGDGLPAYVQQNRPLVGADVVVWYTFGSNHVVRPEDWPVMPVDMLGFFLKPVGFFDGNPALDVPAAEHCEHHAGE